MFGIGEGELVLIVLFAFMIFGPDKLPGMGRTLGRALRQFKNAQEGFTEVVQTNIVDPAAEALSDTPKKPNRNRAAELEEDADLDVPEGEEAPRAKRAETFAERKKRLAEEKRAREAAAAEAEAEKNAATDSSDTDVAEDAPAKPASDGADDPQPKKPSAADLYAMGPSSKSRSAGSVGESPVASREASDERSEERRADGALPDGAGADAAANEKEA
ncbi:twin-arginine translocase TatA/TatE family subunit [Olsenella uli]|uniref:twin-arginine translocase TatA/TatE family subunit n=1 Tax=Olsenella uli TaxID=133926 RepID=UPI00195A7CFD|nr:twin-arginine translocase TatA/TatE family subunit [Olsenella uli]